MKARAPSARMTAPRPIENTTIIGAMMFGRMWNTIVRRSVAPMTRAASTKGCSLVDSTTPLTMRCTLVTPTHPHPAVGNAAALVRAEPVVGAGLVVAGDATSVHIAEYGLGVEAGKPWLCPAH